MNVSTMRIVDRWIGAPLCAALTLVRRLDDLVLRRDPGAAPRRIAVIKPAEQGATVLAYPALARAVEMVGRENLFFVVFAENRFILDLMQVLPAENVIAIRTDGLLRVVADTLRAVVRMRRERIDATVDFEFFARSSAILSYLSGARARVGYHAFSGEASYRGDLMTHRLSFNPLLHASEMFQVLVQALELPYRKLPACDIRASGDGPLPVYRPSVERGEEVESMLRRELRIWNEGEGSRPPLILLNANCGDLLPLRRWPQERYRDLARKLLDRYPEVAVAFTGPPEEQVETLRLAAEVGSDRCVSLAGRTTLEQLIVLYTRSELLVTNDSGPAHYATLTSIDVITLFGPESPAAFGSRSPRSHILWAGIACSPCVNAFNDRQSACRDNLCMQRLDVDQVFELACSVYERRSKRRPQERAGLPGQSSRSASTS